MEIKKAEKFAIVVNPDKDGYLVRYTKNDETGFLFVDMNETDTDAGGQMKRQTKLIFANEHAIPFAKIKAALATAKGVVVDKDGELTSDVPVTVSISGKGAYYNESVAPHYLKQNDGTPLLVSQGPKAGQPAVGDTVAFFAFEGENPIKIFNRIVRSLDIVKAADTFETTEEVPEAAPRGGKRGG